jgi:hypothetical protein
VLPPIFEGVLAVGAATSTYISVRAAFAGFVALVRGGSVEDVARETGAGAAVAFPGGVLVGVAAALYLLLGGP